jgi:4-carboxymuconolactone decarboxylase
MPKTTELFDRGLKVRKDVLGPEYVDAALQRATPFTGDFQTFITECAWGSVWGRPGLDRKTRHMLTIAVLAALGHSEELKLHLKSTPRTGVSREEVKEILLQVAVYAGVPAANSAFHHAENVWRQLDKEERQP